MTSPSNTKNNSMIHPCACSCPALTRAQSLLNRYEDVSQVTKTLDDSPATIKQKTGHVNTMPSLCKCCNQDSQEATCLKEQPTQTIART